MPGTGGGPSPVNEEPKGGCSTSPGLAAIFLSLLVPVVLRRRPRQPAHEG